MSLSVPFDYVSSLAVEFGAVDCFWRESEVSFTGYVAEVWFAGGGESGKFASSWAKVIGRSVRVRGG